MAGADRHDITGSRIGAAPDLWQGATERNGNQCYIEQQDWNKTRARSSLAVNSRIRRSAIRVTCPENYLFGDNQFVAAIFP